MVTRNQRHVLVPKTGCLLLSSFSFSVLACCLSSITSSLLLDTYDLLLLLFHVSLISFNAFHVSLISFNFFQITVRAVVRAKCPPEDVIAACERHDLNASVYDAKKDADADSGTPSKDAAMSGYETPLSEVCMLPQPRRPCMLPLP